MVASSGSTTLTAVTPRNNRRYYRPTPKKTDSRRHNNNRSPNSLTAVPTQAESRRKRVKVTPRENVVKKSYKPQTPAKSLVEKEKWKTVLKTLESMDVATKRWKKRFQKIQEKQANLKIRHEEKTKECNVLKESNKKLTEIKLRQEKRVKLLQNKCNRIQANEAAQIEIIMQQNKELKKHRSAALKSKEKIEYLGQELDRSKAHVKELSKQLFTKCSLVSPKPKPKMYRSRALA